MDMEATMEITCTEGNAVAMVSLFGQHLSKKLTNKYILYLVRVAPDCNRSYCEDSFSGYSGSV